MVRAVVVRFAEVVCPPGVRVGRRADRVLAEFMLMLGVLRPAARRSLLGAFLMIDQGARLYPAARGQRFVRLDDRIADAYLRALLGREDGIAALVQRLKGLLVMCYYELPEVKEEIGYDPDPYIASVTRRRRERYGKEIAAAGGQAGRTDRRTDGRAGGQAGRDAAGRGAAAGRDATRRDATRRDAAGRGAAAGRDATGRDASGRGASGGRDAAGRGASGGRDATRPDATRPDATRPDATGRGAGADR